MTCSQSADGYEPFIFKEHLPIQEIEIADDLFLLKSEDAELYLQKIAVPSQLNKLEINPNKVYLEPNQSQTFTAQGFDQYGQEMSLASIQWVTDGGTIDASGVLTVGNHVGQFTVKAIAGDFESEAIAIVRLPDEQTDLTEVDELNPDRQPKSSSLSWTGDLTTQKWTQFYTKILSKFATDKSVNLNIKLTITIDGDISEQKVNETISGLKELGLNCELNK